MLKNKVLKLASLKVQGKEIQVYSSDYSAIESKKESHCIKIHLWL